MQKHPGIEQISHRCEVPLDYTQPSKGSLQLYAREIRNASSDNKPYLVYLAGGPGFASPRPSDCSGWLKKALERYRVILLDQRGTGLSSPVHLRTLSEMTPLHQADYLKKFRADSIVKDCEVLRQKLLGDGKWSLFGHSFGGFCATHYLSAAPNSLHEVFISAGLPSLERHLDEIYRETYKEVKERNKGFYERYPGDAHRVQEILKYLKAKPTPMPSGGTLTPRRFKQLGLNLGFVGSFIELHYLIEDAYSSLEATQHLNFGVLRAVENRLDFDTNPLYALIHEAIYCQGVASRWSAERVLSEYPEFDDGGEENIFFTGEMVYPWFFEDFAQLRPLQEAAHILAEYESWPILYDVTRLRNNPVPTLAFICADDMYVPRKFSEETAKTLGNCQAWVTDEYEHNALRSDGEVIFGRLLEMRSGL